MNVRLFARLASACAVMALGVLPCPATHAQSLFAGDFNPNDRYPFDGQHPVRQYDATAGAYQTDLAFPGRLTGLTTASDGTLYASNFTDIPPDGSGYRPPDTIERYDRTSGQFVRVADLGVADPYGLKVDAAGNVYVAAKYYLADGRYQGAVLKYDAVSNTVTPVALVNDPYDVALGPNGELYVTAHQYPDPGQNYIGAVLKYNAATQAFDFFASVPEPTGIAFRDGTLYVSSYNYANIWTFDQSGALIGETASVGANPNGLAFDGSGNLYTVTQQGDIRLYHPGPQGGNFTVFADDSNHPLSDPFGLAFTNIQNDAATVPEPPGVAAFAFTGLILGCGLLTARRRASRGRGGTVGEAHA